MSNGITPNDHNRINPYTQQNQKKQADNQPAANDTPVTPAPVERQQVDPDKMMGLLAQMGAQNAANIAGASVERSVGAFSANISPEAHAKLYSSFEKAFKEEFGIDPHPEMVQEALDNYLIGTPVIQQ